MIRITGTVKTLRDMMTPVEAIADECRLNISPEGLGVKVVDPANIAITDLNLPKEVFHEGEYTVDESLQVGLDVINYLSLFKDAGDNERAEINIEQYEEKGVQKHRLILKIADIFKQTLTLMNPDEIRKEIKIPLLTLRAEIEVSKEFLKRCFDMAVRAGDYIRMQAIDKPNIRPLFIIEAGDDVRKFKAELTTGVEITAESPEVRLKSLFSLDYLCGIVEAIGDGEIITMHLDNDMPLKLDFKVLDHGRASVMIAPRIESE
ncbi:MAG: hypothetical protein Q8J68_08075 [Methanolobus sp.]|uniref:hypothetical protein n=1 Tax=Methanolobus sp. TaxID=1874737 RepID=UPI00272F1347|nr:hypothetical protein [Methanolobus sp.]MDP2217226.1 hypothetical protein [Methanolobus sp.]